MLTLTKPRCMMPAAVFILFLGFSVALDTVFIPPPVVTAGVPTPIQLNLSASTCDVNLGSQRGCDWPFFRPWLTADPKFESRGIFLIQPQCFLAPCVTTNLTSFEITLPPSAVPDGYPYSISYFFFNFRDNGTIDSYYPMWSGFQSERFNVTGANTSWTSYDLTSRYNSDNSGRAWFGNVSCEALECARKCADKIVAPKVPFVGDPIPEMDACVEACPAYGWDPTDCITQNAALPSTTAPSSTRGELTSSPTATSIFTDGGTTPTASSHPSLGSTTGIRTERVLWLFWLVSAVVACL
ncbi:hypothetical protein F4677DRAFT_434988 [Hypoxylon crocopeplum]|nr:hypothetical protein F4677DRAFT_434988 [Hypoxylon crocopeplum]